MSLTTQQIEQYFEQGYLVLPALIDETTLTCLNERFLAFVRGEIDLVKQMKVMQDVMVVKGAVTASSLEHAVNKLLCLEND